MKQVNGNVAGIRETLLEDILSIYDIGLEKDTFADVELLNRLAYCTASINREISVYIRRNGVIEDVSVGSSDHVNMPSMRVARNEDRLCGLRCIHTHPNGSSRLSEVDLGTLKSMRLDAMAALGVKDGKPNGLTVSYLGEWGESGFETLVYGPLFKLPQRALMREIYAADERLKSTTREVMAARPERAVLVGLGDDDLDELRQLIETAGGEAVGVSLQKRRAPDNATYIGSGKAEGLALMGSALEADIFVFDDELTAVQLRNLEELLGRPVIDRTALILDIFAKRATTREGVLQVELAQLKYRLPRLMGRGVVLSRLGGGIGTRGPGEKKLEIDRRRIRRRIYELEQALLDVVNQRSLRREKREKASVPLIALVGYTNAGKSTLLNAVSGSDVLVENKLFATLDPVVRQVILPDGMKALFSDTVGFINKLPHELVKAFRATLEEVKNADLILHVVDCANPAYDSQMRVVEEVLTELYAIDTPRLNVYNQIDREGALPGKRGEWAHVSAKERLGLDELLALVERKLNSAQERVELLVPYDKYEALSAIRANGRIISEEHRDDGAHITAMIDDAALWRVKEKLK